MRGHVRRLAVEIGVTGGLSALLSVAAGVFVNFSTDGEPELNPAHVPPAVLFSCLASAVPMVRARWAARSETTTDPYTVKDLAGYKRLLKRLRQEKGTPPFAELDRRAAERGLDVGRADLEKVTKQALRWLDDAERAEPIIRAFLAVHHVPDTAAGTWLNAYRELVAPPPRPERTRRVKPAVLVAVPVVCATVASLGYVAYAESRTRDRLYRPDVAVLSQYLPGRYLAVTGSETAPPRARLGPSIISRSPAALYRWDFSPDKHDGSYHYQIRNRKTRLCLTPEARELTEGGYITEAACDGSAEQLWRLTGDGGISQGGMCVEPNQGSTDAGAPLVLRTCVAGKLAQRWLVTGRMPWGLGSSVASSQNGICLDAAAGMSDLVTWECHGRDNQAFTYRRNARGDYEMRISGTCLGVSASRERRRPVRQACSGGPGQLWRFAFRSPHNDWLHWEVRHVASDLCLQLEPDLRTLSMGSCVRSNVQQWRTPAWLLPPDTPHHPPAPGSVGAGAAHRGTRADDGRQFTYAHRS
ncbi:RICIN domain-containing protein [Nonomuraea sp. NPDC050202]|uniref:RICIN domain-containing protein n=1 Tax=Nonomuraea sp. NPDC050202 TaxID=3155035 RepID=UPI0033FDA224